MPYVRNSISAEGCVFVVSVDSFVLDVAPTGGIKGGTEVAADMAPVWNLNVCTRTLVTVSEMSSVVAVVSIVYGSVVEAM